MSNVQGIYRLSDAVVDWCSFDPDFELQVARLEYRKAFFAHKIACRIRSACNRMGLGRGGAAFKWFTECQVMKSRAERRLRAALDNVRSMQ